MTDNRGAPLYTYLRIARSIEITCHLSIKYPCFQDNDSHIRGDELDVRIQLLQLKGRGNGYSLEDVNDM